MVRLAMNFKPFSVFLLLFIVNGCTTLNVISFNEETSKLEKALEGPVYYLSKGIIDIVVTRKILNCEIDSSSKPPKLKVDFSIEAEVTPKFVPDLARPYLINFEKLNGFTKKTSLKVNLFENGLLKSINASVEDRTGVIIANTTKGAVQIARMVMGLPSAPSERALQDSKLCNEETQEAIKHFKLIKNKVETLEKELPKYGPNESPTKKEELAGLKKLLARYDSHISHKQRYSNLDIQFNEEGNWQIELLTSPSLFVKWFTEKNVEPLISLMDNIQNMKNAELQFYNVSNNQNLSEPIQKIATELNALAEMKIGKRKLSLQSKALANKTASLIYRQPGSAELIICKFSSCIVDDNVIHKKFYSLPQAGIHSTLPLKNKVFDKNVISATFDSSGSLTEFEFITEAQAEASSSSFAQSVAAAGEILDSSRNAETIKLKNELDKTELEIKLLKAKKERDALIE